MSSPSPEPPPNPTPVPPPPPPAPSGNTAVEDSEAGPCIPRLQAATGDYTPWLGQEFASEHEAYEFYRYYAWKLGFSVRREYANKSRKTGEITSRKFVCSREGFKAPDKRTNHTRTPQPDTRTGCHANLVIRRKNDTSKYEVYAFEAQHNHPLFIPSCANPLQKKLSDVQSSDADNSASVTHASEPDSRNSILAEKTIKSPEISQRSLHTRRQREIKCGEASALLNYLQDQCRADPLFYHAVQLDAEDKVTNIFWADAKMVIDFGQFGDVVSFDIVPRNNMNLRPFASFVGFNNYGETVLLGMALMYDDSLESFQWLFETFLHAMSGQAPRTVFSRQDAIVSKAISLVMPDTCHAICTWNLKQSAKSNLNHLIRGDCGFIKEFKACINDYEEEVEFFTAWEAMISKYNLHNNVWLQKVFEEKEKWARPYTKWIFSAGMKNTQLNERLHSDVRDYLKSDVDIISFLKHLKKLVNDRRYIELEVEFSSRLKLPDFKIRAPILRQASEAYTGMIFQLFQEEYEEFQSAYIVTRDESGPSREYIVAILEKERRYKVHGNPCEQTVTCSCRKFETLGFLCSHALKVLDTMDIKYMPDRYILKRWTKYGRCLTAPQVEGRKVQADTTLEFSSRYEYLCPVYVRLVARASECEESYRVLDQCSVELGKKIEEILQKQTSIDASAPQSDIEDVTISLSANGTDNESERALDYSSSTRPKRRKKKGRNAKSQRKSCIEKGLQKTKKVQPEQSPIQYTMLDAAQPGNVLFQGLDISNPFPMGQLNYGGVQSQPGLCPSLPTVSRELGFAAYLSQPSSNNQHNQQNFLKSQCARIEKWL
ncbi:protein FAR1-RELATED SEQUENCE 5 isoform X1 [Oryza sativa Japonica Group]|uniref:protein FAR1-RELATED SEQUENCE 5 isoform X1 n=2 Tax=Oryza sativa subsp. japonica TaxID=39947 RepID=UPI00077536E4|nr:protein FAR1-RELATED SEQUENCE 7 isoform X1 [Oryza sativa Japonica Group]